MNKKIAITFLGLLFVVCAWAANCSNDCEIGFFYPTDKQQCSTYFTIILNEANSNSDYEVEEYDKLAMEFAGFYNGTNNMVWGFHFSVLQLGQSCAVFAADGERHQACTPGESLMIVTQITDAITVAPTRNITVHGCM